MKLDREVKALARCCIVVLLQQMWRLWLFWLWEAYEEDDEHPILHIFKTVLESFRLLQTRILLRSRTSQKQSNSPGPEGAYTEASHTHSHT
jgi:hypothetical protein